MATTDPTGTGLATNGSSRPRPPASPKGASGTKIYGGIIQTDEMTPEFRGQTLFRTVDRMVRSDPVVRAALLMVVLPIREAEWTISPAGPTEEDREAAELVRRAFFEHNDWPQVIWDLVHPGLRYGRGVLEEVYGAVDWSLTYDDDEGTVEVPSRTYWVPRRYGPRLARTIQRWHVDEEGDLEAVEQLLPHMTRGRGSGHMVTIPASQLVVWVNERDGDNYEGVSMLRPMFRAWFTKDKLEIIDAIRAERAGVGVPIGWAGDGDEADLEEHLKHLRVNEEGFIVLAGGPPGSDDHHQHVEMLDMRAASTADISASLHYHTTQILWAVLGAWQNLGQGNVGARATSETQDDPYYLLISSIAKAVAAAFNRQSIPRLIAYNYPNLDRLPRLTVGSLPGADFTSVVDAVAKLLTAGGIESDLDLENHLRRIMGMPERKPDEDDEPEPEPTQEPPPGATAPPAAPGDDDQDPTQQEGPTSEDSAPGDLEDDSQELGMMRRIAHALAATTRALPPASGTPASWGAPVAHWPTPSVAAAASAPSTYTTRMADGSDFTTWRPLSPLETHVSFQATDTAIVDMREEYVRAATEQVQRLATFAAGAAAGEATPDHDLIVAVENDLAETIAVTLTRTAAFGRAAVRSEISSQRGVNRKQALTVAEADAALAKRPPKDPGRLEGWITKISRDSARAVTTRVTHAANRGGTRMGPLPHDKLLERVTTAGEAALKAEAAETVAHALAAGRRAEAEEAVDRGESAGTAVYSAVLDAATCTPCRSRDGVVYDVGSAEYSRDYPPLWECDGRDRCRCIMIVQATDEDEPFFEILPEQEIDPTAH